MTCNVQSEGRLTISVCKALFAFLEAIKFVNYLFHVFAFVSSSESDSWFAIALNDKEGSESHDRVLAEHTLVVNRYQYPGQQCAAWCSAPFLT